MIISFSKKFIFIKTRKCGGTSIQNTLLPFCSLGDEVTLGHTNVITGKPSKLNEFSLIPDLEKLYNIQKSDFFKFCIIRNPFEITLSRYLFNIKKGRISEEINQTNFNKWVSEIYLQKNEYIMDKYSSYIFSSHGDLELDFIMRLENLENDFNQLKLKLELSNELEVKNENRSNFNNLDYREWINEKSKKLIYEMFEFEINHFKYSF